MHGERLIPLLSIIGSMFLASCVTDYESFVEGFVWIEAGDADGVWNQGEEKLAGVKVQLYEHDGPTSVELLSETVTSDSGEYIFSPIDNRFFYHLQFTLPGDYEITQKDAGEESIDSDVYQSGEKAGQTDSFDPDDGAKLSAGLVPVTVDLELTVTDEEPTAPPVVDTTTEFEPEVFSAADPADDCQDFNTSETFSCNADIVGFEISFDEDTNSLVFSFTFSEPPELSELEICGAIDLDSDALTGSSQAGLVGTDMETCYSGLDAVTYVILYGPQGTFMSSTDLENSVGQVVLDPDTGEPGLNPFEFKIHLDVFEGNTSFDAMGYIILPPTTFEVTDPISLDFTLLAPSTGD